MNNHFRVRVLSVSTLQEIEGVWRGDDFAALLDAMDYGDTSGMGEGELREMCILSLQDLDPEEAAALVIKHILGDRLKDGQVRTIANEMPDDKLWEQYADMSLHEPIFNIGSLLFAAFPRVFPEPDAVRVRLEIVATNEDGKEALGQPLHESFLVRLLADGMNDDAILHRLFQDQLDGKSFPDAAAIVWIVRAETSAADTVQVDLISSGYWLDSLRDTETYDSTAYADGG
jgi:hypothetical protein